MEQLFFDVLWIPDISPTLVAFRDFSFFLGSEDKWSPEAQMHELLQLVASVTQNSFHTDSNVNTVCM